MTLSSRSHPRRDVTSPRMKRARSYPEGHTVNNEDMLHTHLKNQVTLLDGRTEAGNT
jgi:hypothetical protein